MTAEEKEKIISMCVEKAKGKCKVIAGTGSNNTAASVAATKQAKELGADAVLIVNPYYNKPSQEGLYRHICEIAKVGIPIVLYNIPGRSSILMQPSTIARLFNDCKEVIAVKEATGSLDIAAEIRSLCDITVLSGDDSLTLPLMGIGGKGVISVLSNYKPERVQSIVKPALNGDFAAAAEALRKNFKLMKAMFMETNPVPVKTAMSFHGLMSSDVRLPLAPMTVDNHNKLLDVLTEYKILDEEPAKKKRRTE